LPEAAINQNAVEGPQARLAEVTEWALQRRLSPEFAGYIEQTKAAKRSVQKAMPKEYPIASGLADNKEANDLKVFLRGDPYVFGEDAPRGFLSIFSGTGSRSHSPGQRRLELAEEILKQPIAMRVMVNRIWKW